LQAKERERKLATRKPQHFERHFNAFFKRHFLTPIINAVVLSAIQRLTFGTVGVDLRLEMLDLKNTKHDPLGIIRPSRQTVKLINQLHFNFLKISMVK
jgi:hypothetical protein